MPGPHELAQIKGIGEATASWLTETFGARTPRDLAGLDGAAVEAALATRRPAVSRAAVDGWIAEARLLMAADDHRSGTNAGARPAAADGWQPLASFVVEFQVTAGSEDTVPERMSVHHLENDDTEILPGADCRQLGNWMSSRLPTIGPAERPLPPSGAYPGRVSVPLSAALELTGHLAGGLSIPLDGPWSVLFEWSTAEGESLPEGEWMLDVILESAGAGLPVRPRGAPVRVLASSGVTSYRELYPVAAGAVPIERVDAPFRGTATLTFRPTGSKHALLASFVDLGIVRFWASEATGSAARTV